MDTKIKLTGLWENKTKSGEIYFSGNLSPTTRILIFKNNHKQDDKHPDWLFYIAPKDNDQQGQGSRGSREPHSYGEEYTA